MIEDYGHIKTSGAHNQPTGKSRSAAQTQAEINAEFHSPYYYATGRAPVKKISSVLLDSKKLRKLQEAKGWKNNQLAEIAGTSPAPVTNARRGRRITRAMAALLCEALGVTLDALEVTE